MSWWHADSSPGGGLHRDAMLRNHGQSAGSVLFGAGKQANGWKMTGGSYVEVPHSSSLQFDKEFTLEAWVNASFDGSIVSKISPGGQDGFQLDIHNSKLRFLVGWPAVAAPDPFPFDQLTHVVAVFVGGASMRLYINGQKVVERTDVGILPSTPSSSLPMRFGVNLNGDTASKFKGTMDEVRIYKKALTDAQVKVAYDGKGCSIVDAIRWDFIGTPVSFPGCNGGVAQAVPIYTDGVSGVFSHTASGCDTGGYPFVTNSMDPTDVFPFAKLVVSEPLEQVLVGAYGYTNATSPFTTSAELSTVDAASPKGTDGFTVLGTFVNSPGVPTHYGLFSAGNLPAGTYYLRYRATTKPLPYPSSVQAFLEQNVIGVKAP